MTDFAILDANDRLLLIELEKPGLQLFKQNGHPTAKLMHAYEQVRDWLHEYSKHRGAVLEGMELDSRDIRSVRGVVIAGRSKRLSEKHLQRHLEKPPFSEIEFMTLDELAHYLAQISRDIA